MRRLAFALTITLAFASLTAEAQWAWRDDKGGMVYSDQPPPPGTAPSKIVKSPNGTSDSAKPSAPVSEVPAASSATPAKKSTAELEADFRKRQMERAAAEKKSDEEAKRTSQKSANCERAKTYMKSLDAGIRVRLPNGDFADDAQRAAEKNRAQEVVKQDCK